MVLCRVVFVDVGRCFKHEHKIVCLHQFRPGEGGEGVGRDRQWFFLFATSLAWSRVSAYVCWNLLFYRAQDAGRLFFRLSPTSSSSAASAGPSCLSLWTCFVRIRDSFLFFFPGASGSGFIRETGGMVLWRLSVNHIPRFGPDRFVIDWFSGQIALNNRKLAVCATIKSQPASQPAR